MRTGERRGSVTSLVTLTCLHSFELHKSPKLKNGVHFLFPNHVPNTAFTRGNFKNINLNVCHQWVGLMRLVPAAAIVNDAFNTVFNGRRKNHRKGFFPDTNEAQARQKSFLKTCTSLNCSALRCSPLSGYNEQKSTVSTDVLSGPSKSVYKSSGQVSGGDHRRGWVKD